MLTLWSRYDVTGINAEATESVSEDFILVFEFTCDRAQVSNVVRRLFQHSRLVQLKAQLFIRINTRPTVLEKQEQLYSNGQAD